MADKVWLVFKLDRYVTGLRSETVWAEDLGKDQYVVCNIPFLVEDVSIGDIVYAPKDRRGMPTFQKVMSKAGNRTVRFVMPEDDTEPRLKVEDLPVFDELRDLGCSIEGFEKDIFSLNVPGHLCLVCVLRRLEDEGAICEVSDAAAAGPDPSEVH